MQMLTSFRRPLLVALFLLAVLSFNSLWLLAGGQNHLDLLFWPWKPGLSLAAAGFVVMLATAAGKRAWLAAALLVATMVVAGLVTYEAHLNEPVDEDGENSEQLTRGLGHGPLPTPKELS